MPGHSTGVAQPCRRRVGSCRVLVTTTAATAMAATSAASVGCWVLPSPVRTSGGVSCSAGARSLQGCAGQCKVKNLQPLAAAAASSLLLVCAAQRRAQGRAREAASSTWRSAHPTEASAPGEDLGMATTRRPFVAGSVSMLLGNGLPAHAKAPDAGGVRLAALTPEALSRAKGKVFLITGATAGVGLEASRNLVGSGAEVYMCGRTLEKAKAAVEEVTSGQPAGGKAIPLALDLASFDSIRSFASTWKSDVKRPVDVLALNAGLALKSGLKVEEAPLSKDGLELTVATNHLGHFLLYNLLQDQLSPTARVVVTASSVHDPATGDPGAQATLGDLSGLGAAGAQGLMVNGGAYDSQKAYKDSKLCNVLFTLELARRLKKEGSQVTVNCLSPGLIPSKTFFRNQDPGFSGAFAFAASNVLKIAETTEFGGDTLTFMALDPSLDGRSGVFYSAVPPGQHVFVEKTPSAEALSEKEAEELWRRSAAVVGL